MINYRRLISIFFAKVHAIWIIYLSRIGETSANQSDILSLRLLSGISWSVFGALLSRALLMGNTVALGRILGTSGFGEFGIIQSTLMLFGISIGAVLSLTVTKETAEFRNINPIELGKTISLFFEIGILLGLTCGAATFILSPWLAEHFLGQPSLALELQIASILIITGILYSLQNGVIAGLEDFRLLTVTLTIRAVLALVFQILGAYYLGLKGAVLGLVFAEVFTTIGIHWLLVRLLVIRNIPLVFWKMKFNNMNLVYNISLPILIGSIAIQIAFWTNNALLVNQTKGFQSFGIFVAADKWRQILLFLPSSMSVAILPILSNLFRTNKSNDFKIAFITNLLTNLLLVIAPSILLMLLSKQAMSVYGENYKTGSITLVILSFSAVFTMLNSVLGQVLVSINMIWRRSALDILLAIGLISSGRLLIPRFNENGLALALVISYGLVSLLLSFIAYHYISKGKVMFADK